MKVHGKKFIVLLAALMTIAGITACSSGGGGGDGVVAHPALQASGGTGHAGVGGTGGEIYVESSGSIKILKSGKVDASFTVSAPTPSYGTYHAEVNGTVTVVLDDTEPGNNLCTSYLGDGRLYLGDGNSICGDAGDIPVTGLTVNSGATLVLVDNFATVDVDTWGGYGTLVLPNDLVINGTIKTDALLGLYIEANLIQVGASGKITTSATDAGVDANAKPIYLGYGNGMTKTIINHGTIEARGLDTGSGGLISLRSDELVVNYGTIDTSGGSSTTGAGGNGYSPGSDGFDVYVDYGDFNSSGIVRMNGGDGGDGNGGDAGQAYIQTAYSGNTGGKNGDIMISGTWEAMGGDGTNGNGGSGGYLRFETDAMGKVYVNAAMSTKGGNGTGAASVGGSSTGIDIYSYNYGSVDVATPGKVRIAGHFDVRGGNGDLNGNDSGFLQVKSYGSTTAFQGTDVELILPAAIMSGGTGSVGGNASDLALEAYTYTPQYPNYYDGSANTTVPGGSIVNESNIEAKGGKATGAGGTGGFGGYVDMEADYDGSVADATTTILNSGSIDISGGAGNTGGNAYDLDYSMYLYAQNVTNTGTIKANGGTGKLLGGNGGVVYVYSYDTPSVNTGTIQTLKGAGKTPGYDGEQYLDDTLIWP